MDLTMPPLQEGQNLAIPMLSYYLGSIYHELGSIEWKRSGVGGEMLQGDISPAGDSEAIGRVEQIVERLQLNILQVMHDTEHVNSGYNLDILRS